jgi:hypothetical protein
MSLINSSMNNGAAGKRENVSSAGYGLNSSHNASQVNMNPKNKKRVH